jgi:hypothetical protein
MRLKKKINYKKDPKNNPSQSILICQTRDLGHEIEII